MHASPYISEQPSFCSLMLHRHKKIGTPSAEKLRSLCVPVGVAAVVKIAMCKPSLFCLIVVFHSGFGLTDSYWIVPFYTLRRQVSLPMRQVEMWLTGHSRKSDGRGSPFSHWGPHFSGKMGTRGPHFYGGPQNFMTPGLAAVCQA